jgi:hypothetical protein
MVFETLESGFPPIKRCQGKKRPCFFCNSSKNDKIIHKMIFSMEETGYKSQNFSIFFQAIEKPQKVKKFISSWTLSNELKSSN